MKTTTTMLHICMLTAIFSQDSVAQASAAQHRPQTHMPVQQPAAVTQTVLQVAPDNSAVLFRGINTLTKAKVTGRFSRIQGQVLYDPTNIQNSKVRLRIPVKTLTTRKADVKHKRFKQVSDERLAGHMLSESFFGLYRKKGKKRIMNTNRQYIKFTSKSVAALGVDAEKQQLKICGVLTIRGKRKKNQCFTGNLTNTTFNGSAAKRFVGRAVIDRREFDVGTGWMTFTIANNVNIQMNVLLHERGSVASQQHIPRSQSSS